MLKSKNAYKLNFKQQQQQSNNLNNARESVQVSENMNWKHLVGLVSTTDHLRFIWVFFCKRQGAHAINIQFCLHYQIFRVNK